MENGRAGKVKKKKKEAEDMEQELLQEIVSYWGTRAEGYSEVNEKELAGSQREAWLHVLEEQFPEKKKEEMKILDIGTGPGFFPMILSEAGYTVTAVDYTEEMLEKAKENLGKYTKYGLERVTLQRMDAQNLEFADETFDVVISRNLTWNLEEPQKRASLSRTGSPVSIPSCNLTSPATCVTPSRPPRRSTPPLTLPWTCFFQSFSRMEEAGTLFTTIFAVQEEERPSQSPLMST